MVDPKWDILKGLTCAPPKCDILKGFRHGAAHTNGKRTGRWRRTGIVGERIPRLDDFDVPVYSLVRECQRGKLERAQEYLSDAVANDADFLRLFDDFVVDAILPRLKARLRSAVAHDDGGDGDGRHPDGGVGGQQG